jgi:hypothetical protein
MASTIHRADSPRRSSAVSATWAHRPVLLISLIDLADAMLLAALFAFALPREPAKEPVAP